MATASLERSSGSVAKRLRRWCANFVGGLAFVLIAAGLVRPAAAITIFMEYDSEDEEPGWDSDGSILKAHFGAAAWIWEELLPSQGNPPTTYTIQIEWEDDWDNSSTLGSWTWPKHIEINSNQNWFYGAPNDNDDFDFTNPATPDPINQGQTLYRDLTPSQQSAWFPGTTPPDLLEVGFRGNANAVPGSPAQGLNDLLSTIVHEMGHHLGINGEEPGEYNIYPHHVGGLTNVLVKEDDDSAHLAGDGSAPWVMQEGGGLQSVRRLPSATDVLVIAEDQGLPAVHLPRVDRISSGSWNSPQSWIGGQVPVHDQHVFVRHGGTVSLGGDATIKSLLIAEASSVSTQSHTLTVPGQPTIVSLASELQADANGHVELDQLDLNDGGALTMNGGTAKVWEGLNINLSSGSRSSIQGHGYVEVALPLHNNGVIRADGGTLAFGYGGLSPAPLDLDGDVAGEDGWVQAGDGDLLFGAGLTDEFDGRMSVGEDRTITMGYGGDWTLGPDGVLNFFTGPTTLGLATLDGAQNSRTIVRGDIDVWGRGVIATMVVFEPTAEVSIDASVSRLLLEGVATTYRGGSYTGGGTLEQRGPASVEENTQIDVLFYDFDGDEANPSTTAISPYKTFTINSHYVELFAENDYDGIIVNNGGKLKVYTMTYDEGLPGYVPAPWKIDQGAYLYLTNGKIPMEIPTGPGAEVHGSPLIVAGHVVASGEDNVIASGKDKDNVIIPGPAVTFLATADVQTPSADSQLYLVGPTTYRGGSYTGEGAIYQDGDATIVENTMISVHTYDWDGSFEAGPSTTSIGSGVRFFIRSEQIDEGNDGFDGLVQIHVGTLIVNTRDFDNLMLLPWRLDQGGVMNLFDGAVVSGTSDPNNLAAPGSPMLVSGDINAWGLGNVIYSPTTFENTADVQVESGSILTLGGTTVYQGGSYGGEGILVQEGQAIVEQSTTIGVSTFDMDGNSQATSIKLFNNLRLNVDRLDVGDNVFDGNIYVEADASLTVDTSDIWVMNGLMDVPGPDHKTFEVHGTHVQVDGTVYVEPSCVAVFYADTSGLITNFFGGGEFKFLGNISPGTSPAVWKFEGDVTLGDTATLIMEIGEGENTDRTTAYDELRIIGDLSLSGSLRVQALGKLAAVGDTARTILTAGRINGTFSNEPAVGDHLGYGLFLSNMNPKDPGSPGVNYTGTAVEVYLLQALEGDTDGDRDVDFPDFGNFAPNYTGTLLPGEGTNDWTRGDFDGDGDTDFPDFGLFAPNFGRVYAPQQAGEAVQSASGDASSKDAPAEEVTLVVDVVSTAMTLQGNDTLFGYSIASEEGSLIPDPTGNANPEFMFYLSNIETDVTTGSFGQWFTLESELLLRASYNTEIDARDLTFAYISVDAGTILEAPVVYVPEPGMLVLLASGALSLLVVAIRRRRVVTGAEAKFPCSAATRCATSGDLCRNPPR